MAPRGGGCWYFIMEWPGIIRSGLFLSLYNRWLAGSWGDVLIRVKRCGNQEMLKRWEHFEPLLLRWLFYRHWLGVSRRGGGGQVLDTETWTGESWPDQTLDTGFLSAVMSVGLNCVSRASYWNSILLAITPSESCELYPDRWDLRFSLRFKAKIFISRWKNVSTCRIKSLFFCLGINHKSLFFVEKFFPIVSKYNCRGFYNLPEVFVMSEYFC